LKFEEIATSIQQFPNEWEQQQGITTTKVEYVIGGPPNHNWAIFIAYKSDNTKTLFYARKGQRADEYKWNWFCPSEAEFNEGLPYIVNLYKITNIKNETSRCP